MLKPEFRMLLLALEISKMRCSSAKFANKFKLVLFVNNHIVQK